MITLIEFKRVASEENDWKYGVIHVQPAQVVKIEPYERGTQGLDTLLTLASGTPEVVEGPPSEIMRRLRGGQ